MTRRTTPSGQTGTGPRVLLAPPARGRDHGRIVAGADDGECLDAPGLAALEQAFRQWAAEAPRPGLRQSRQRVLAVFLLIRYTGAKLSEALALDPGRDIDWERGVVRLGGGAQAGEAGAREVHISGVLAADLRAILESPALRGAGSAVLDLDPGFVRRKFYERAQAAGFDKRLGGPEMIRKARAVELLQGNVPLPVVQAMLGHVTPTPTSAYVSFSPQDIQQVARVFLDREAQRGTSARNAFYGKVQALHMGDIQARVELATLDGLRVVSVITRDSVGRLGVRPGRLMTAEVKAPLVSLLLRQPGAGAPASSFENVFAGVVEGLTLGVVNAECVARVSDGTQLCAIVPAAWARERGLKAGDAVWVLFCSYAVVLHVD